MGKILRINESNLARVIKRIVEQVDSEYYKISPEDFLNLLPVVSYNPEILSKTKKFGGKKFNITGGLNLSGLPIETLKGIGKIDGYLDISNTNIGDISGVQVTGYIRDYNSKREKLKLAAELRQKRSDADERRRENEWDPENTDEEGLKANALFEFLVNDGELQTATDEEKEELKTLREKLDELKEIYDSDELEPNEVSSLYDEISEIEDRIDEITTDYVDVYELVKLKYTHYGLDSFEILSLPNREYTVGTESEMDDAVLEYAKSYIDDVGVEGFRRGFIEDYLDEDEIRYYIEDFYENDVQDNPDIYFSDDDFELTQEQEERKEQLETYISEMEDMKSELEDEQNELENDSDEYNELQEKIEEVEENIEKAQDELDGIEVDTEPTEEMIDEKVQELVDDRMRDPIGFLREFGLEVSEYVDKDALAQGLADSDGYGIMSSYDGDYDTIDFNGETYYIMRVN